MRELRQKAKLTATDIAERLNFTVPYILDLESGRRGWSKDLQAAYVEAVKLNGK
jgi:transcriptional regulator with XRE-family HTH domain